MSRSDVFWGVDFSCKAASIGWRSEEGRGVVTSTWDKDLRGGARLSAAYSSIYRDASNLSVVNPAVFVYVEQPRSMGSSMELTYMCGVVQMAVYDALFEEWSKEVQVMTVPPSKWKKLVLGRGDYKKPKKSDDFEYEGILWCEKMDIEVSGHDEADAVCIAEYASLVVKFV